MKYIVIDARIISSSTGRYVERLLHHLQTIDTENHYTVLVRRKDERYWQPKNPNFTVKVAEYAPFSFSEQLGFLRFLRSLSPDLVHFTYQGHQPILYTGKRVATIHDLTLLKTYNSDKNWFVYHAKQLVGRLVFRLVIKTSQHIICPTDFVRDEIISMYRIPESRITRTYESAELTTTKKKKYQLPSTNFLLYVGQQSDYKNIKRLCDAHQQLLKDRPSLQLVLVGKMDGAARRTREYVQRNAYKNITFTGFVDDDELNWLYKNTSAYVFPSLMEGFGLPGLEAMVHSTPVVASNATCLPEVYGNAAHYFDPRSVVSMSEAISDVLDDQQLKNKLVENGKERLKRFSWQIMAEQTLSVYEDVLSK